ncbi:MAG: transporter [Lewinellaceae bacterium]|nr:transporter [Lewinellaceae bacterium]
MSIRMKRSILVRSENRDDFGFSSKVTGDKHRLINKDGSFNIRRKGKKTRDVYHWLVHMKWGRFLILAFTMFVFINLVLALAFLWIGIDQIQGTHPGTFMNNLRQAFFFSIQTFTTVGYGVLSPEGIGANWLAALSGFLGLFSFSIFTGLSFVRFSRPQTRIRFSRNMLVNYEEEVPRLLFRMVNLRRNKLFNVEANMIISWIAQEAGEQAKRRFAALDLVRDRVIMFPANWTLVHYIDENSPLFAKSREQLIASHAEIMITTRAFDETYAQEVHSNYSYTADELVWGAQFELMYEPTSEGTILNIDRIDAFVQPG